jgi:pyruvate dehydrogenase E2 component (dihydrolipoamide acetyltransferase)
MCRRRRRRGQGNPRRARRSHLRRQRGRRHRRGEAPQAPAAPEHGCRRSCRRPAEVRCADFDSVPVRRLSSSVKVDDALVTLESGQRWMSRRRTGQAKSRSSSATRFPLQHGGGRCRPAARTAAPPCRCPAPPQALQHGRRATGCRPPRRARRTPARRCACFAANSASTSTRSRPADRKAHPQGRHHRLRQGRDDGAGRQPRRQRPSLGGGLDLLPWPKVDFAKFGPSKSSRWRASRRFPARTWRATG